MSQTSAVPEVTPETVGSTAEPPDLSIIIVSWNVRELLAGCLDSILVGKGSLKLEVIVVDSGSTDGSPELVAQAYPWVELLRCDENVGFPKGNNLGIGLATGRHLMLLNPDTVLLQDALQIMLDFLHGSEGVGVVGPQLVNGDGSPQSSRRRFPTIATAFVESTWLERFAPPSVLSRYYAEDLPYDAPVEVDWVVGACMLVRGAAVEQVGKMDEGYFMYSEELDWCRRIKDAGWAVIFHPDAQVVHYLGKSSEQAITARHINFQRAKLRYFLKHHGAAAAWLLRLFLLLTYCWQLMLEAFKGVIGHRRPLRRQRVKAYWQVLRSGLRPAGMD